MVTMMKTVDPAKAKAFFEEEMAFTTGPIELDRMRQQQKEALNIIDVREPEDFVQGHVPGAVNLPKARWSSFEGLSKDKTNVLYCYSVVCHLAKAAAVEFANQGYPVMEMDGGFKAWKENELEVER